MKSKLILLAVSCCCFVTVIQVRSQGYIVPNGVVSNFDGLFFAGEIDVLHNPANPNSGGSYTGFLLDPVNADTFQFNPVLDVGVRVFLVSSNNPVSLQPILSQSYTELLSPNNYVFANGVPFYVGLYTGNMTSPPPNGIYSDPLFGWAELENVNGTVEILNSALEYQGGGIYAGTQNIIAIPEPSTLGFSVLGGWLLAWRRWKTRTV
jgi:hypothetical protein